MAQSSNLLQCMNFFYGDQGVPNEVRYQAALHSDIASQADSNRAGRRFYSPGPPHSHGTNRVASDRISR